MNKLILSIVFCFTLCGCAIEVDTTFEYTNSLVNETDKVLSYYVRTTHGSDSAFSYGHDSIGFYFVHYAKLSLPPIGPYRFDIEGVGLREETLYNLTDTSFFEKNLIRSTWTGKDTLYWKHVEYRALNGPNRGEHQQHFETLRFRDTLSSIMQKDSTMLEKFSEYYTKSKNKNS